MAYGPEKGREEGVGGGWGGGGGYACLQTEFHNLSCAVCRHFIFHLSYVAVSRPVLQ